MSERLAGAAARGRAPRVRARGGRARGAAGDRPVPAAGNHRRPGRALRAPASRRCCTSPACSSGRRRARCRSTAAPAALWATPSAPACGASGSASSTSSTICCPTSPHSRTWRCRSSSPAAAGARRRGARRALLARLGLADRVHAPPGPALGRRAAAGRDRPGAGQRPGAAAGRRAHRQSRPAHGRRGLRRCCSRSCATTGTAALIATHNPELAARMDEIYRLTEAAGGRAERGRCIATSLPSFRSPAREGRGGRPRPSPRADRRQFSSADQFKDRTARSRTGTFRPWTTRPGRRGR